MQKVRSRLSAPTVRRRMASGSFHPPLGVLFTFPSRYSFTIGQWVVLRLGRWSSQIPPGFHVPQGTQESCRPALIFAYGGVTLCAVPSQTLPLIAAVPCSGPTTPTQKPGLVWPVPRSLAATNGVSIDFLSSGYLDVSVPLVGSLAGSAASLHWVSPFGHPRIIACLPAPRGLSQAPTSFIASYRQGIHRVPLVACSPRSRAHWLE